MRKSTSKRLGEIVHVLWESYGAFTHTTGRFYNMGIKQLVISSLYIRTTQFFTQNFRLILSVNYVVMPTIHTTNKSYYKGDT